MLLTPIFILNMAPIDEPGRIDIGLVLFVCLYACTCTHTQTHLEDWELIILMKFAHFATGFWWCIYYMNLFGPWALGCLTYKTWLHSIVLFLKANCKGIGILYGGGEGVGMEELHLFCSFPHFFPWLFLRELFHLREMYLFQQGTKWVGLVDMQRSGAAFQSTRKQKKNWWKRAWNKKAEGIRRVNW